MNMLALIVAVVLFLLAAFGVDSKLGVGFVPLGLAAFALSFLLPATSPWRRP